MPKQVLIVFFLCFFCLSGMAHSARAGALEGIPAIDMPEFLLSDDQTLVLSGSGIRRVLFMEPYAAGLYLQKTATGGSAVMTADEPVILRLHFLAPMSRRMMVRSLYNGMVDAAESLEWDFSQVEERFDRLADSFANDIDQGDIIEFRYIPGRGTRVVRNGRTQDVVDGLDFKAVFFGVWLNEKKPVDKDLRAALLRVDAGERTMEKPFEIVAEADPDEPDPDEPDSAKPTGMEAPDAAESDMTLEKRPESPQATGAIDRNAPFERQIEDFEQTSIYFGFDNASLTADAKGVLDEKADWLRDHPDVDIVMVVYADHLGSAEYNRRLSERRAASAGDYLKKKGVDPSRIHTRVYGSEGRASSQSGETAEERARNRRIDFRVLSYAPPSENGDEQEE